MEDQKRCKFCGIIMTNTESDICECCMDDGIPQPQETKHFIIDEMLQRTWEQLRPYQKEGIETMKSRRHNLNFDDMGLGKTVSTLWTALYKARDIFAEAQFNPRSPYKQMILIVCPSKALYVWKNEIYNWFGYSSIIYTGTPKQREKIREEMFYENAFVITTYGMLKELQGYSWRGIIADEIHEAGLLNHKTKTYDIFSKYYTRIAWSFLLTGTPIRQGVIDLYAPLHLADGNVFSNYWQFVNKYCIVIDTPFGKEIQRNPRDIAGFRKILDHYMIRRLKSEVLKDLPGKQRQPIPLQMTPKQAKAHQDIMEEFIYSDTDALVVTQNAMSATLRARQILVTPRLLGIDEDGAALEYLKAEGKNLLESGNPFVVFTPFRSAIPIIADVIAELGLATKVYTITGGLKPNEFANQWQGFQENPSTNKVLICVIKSGASFHATAASDCFFLGYEWDFNLNSQSEDRLCRLGQKNFVNCRYLLHEGTVDEDVKEKLNSKNDASNWIVGTEQQYQMMLKRVRAKVI